jgi:hypothetical protein
MINVMIMALNVKPRSLLFMRRPIALGESSRALLRSMV